MANHRIKHLTVRRSRRRVAGYWEIRNTTGVVAIVYTGEDDAKRMASWPRLLSELKHAEAILRMHEGELRASAKATLARIRALINELNGGH